MTGPDCRRPGVDAQDPRRSPLCAGRRWHFLWPDYGTSEADAEEKRSAGENVSYYYSAGPEQAPRPDEDSMSTYGPDLPDGGWQAEAEGGGAWGVGASPAETPDLNEAKFRARLALLAARTPRSEAWKLVDAFSAKLGLLAESSPAVRRRLRTIREWSLGTREMANATPETVVRELVVSLPWAYREDVERRYGGVGGVVAALLDFLLAAVGVRQEDLHKLDDAVQEAWVEAKRRLPSLPDAATVVALVGAGALGLVLLARR